MALRAAKRSVPLHRQRRVQVGRFRHAGDEVGIILQLKLGFGVEDIDQRQVMPFADLEIVEVVRRRDLTAPDPFSGSE